MRPYNMSFLIIDGRNSFGEPTDINPSTQKECDTILLFQKGRFQTLQRYIKILYKPNFQQKETISHPPPPEFSVFHCFTDCCELFLKNLFNSI